MKIPARYESAKWDDVPKNIRELFQQMESKKKGVYITGPVGSGKTHIVYALLKRMQEMKRYPRFWNATELMYEIKADFDRDRFDKRRAAEDLMGFEGVLIIDDIGSEKMTEFVSEMFYLIVNRRYNEMRPTIFTSNLDLDKLAERVGDRTASRIAEMCEVARLTGGDRRIS